MRSLLEVIEDRIHVLQKECNPLTLRHRFSTLPDDILQRVFEVGSTPDKHGCRFSLQVSHVSRRFRDVALRTPRMWNVVHDGQTIAQITTSLSRSKSVDIGVFVGDQWEFESNWRRTNIETFMNIVTQHSQRWSMFGCYVNEGEDDVMGRCLACPGLALPNLTSLSCSRAYFEDPPGLGLFSSWSKPLLSQFYGSDITLQPSMLGENLTSCHLDFDGREDEDRTWNFTGVLDALASTRALSELTLNFEDVRSEHIVQDIPDISIPSLATFHMSFIRCNTSKLIPPIMFALRTPNLSHLFVTLDMRSDCQDDSKTPIAAIFLDEKPYPHLLSLNLTAHNNELILPDLLVFLATKSPSLVNLSFEGVDFDPTRLPNDCPVSWATVKLDFCDLLLDESIESIIENVQQNGKWDDFKKLKISNCRGLSLSYLRDLKARIGDKLDYELQH
ncbi:hypothetical protein BD410DRAFT_54797 [Rickenella mellea]|uniref:F-box domain-containing protein n=1 Tax=Rickenella mellea TaxID=50990 RepID=A0A4R5XHN2_9AGAM|nr:hypothetical protein BD410DRAFT_54797 [Rickenella mellea]